MKAIITVEQYERLTNQKLEESKKEFAKVLINVVSDMIESHIGYDLEKQDRTEIIQKNIKINRFWVKYPPINSVISVLINEKDVETEDYISTTKKIELTDYFCSGCNNCTFTKEDKIVLKYNSGFTFGDNGDVPYDLQYYVAMMIRDLMLLQEDPDMQKYSNYKINDIAYTYKDNRIFNTFIIPILKGLLM
jgi:conserved domain protein